MLQVPSFFHLLEKNNVVIVSPAAQSRRTGPTYKGSAAPPKMLSTFLAARAGRAAKMARLYHVKCSPATWRLNEFWLICVKNCGFAGSSEASRRQVNRPIFR